MNLKINELCIRSATKDDCPQLVAWWNDGGVMAHAGFPHGLHTTLEEVEDKLKTDEENVHERLVILYNDQLIGEMSYYIEDKEVEIGIKICNEEYQNKGYGRVLLKAIIQELFDRGNELIYLDTNLKNTRAQHVYESIGFQKVDEQYDCWKDQDGVLQSTVFYELTKEQFKK